MAKRTTGTDVAAAHRVLSDHFARVKAKLQEYSRHFDIAAHGDIKGYGREALVGEFLSTHLPSVVEYLTGEILDPQDRRSGQVDVIIQSNLQPKIPLISNVHLSFIDAVVAVVEVKSTLTTQHLTAALDNFRRIKALSRSVVLHYPAAVDLEAVPCILFAFRGPTKDTVIRSINDYAGTHQASLDSFAPDMVVVLESDYYICKNDGWQFPRVLVSGAYFRDWAGLPHETLVGMYNYVNNLIRAYAAAQPGIRIDAYFDKSVLPLGAEPASARGRRVP